MVEAASPTKSTRSYPDDEPGRLTIQTPEGKKPSKEDKNTTPGTVKSDIEGQFEEQDSSESKGRWTKSSLLKLGVLVFLSIVAFVLILILATGNSGPELPDYPTQEPTMSPTQVPTTPPVNFPTAKPTPFPTKSPTVSPTASPTDRPTSDVEGDIRVILTGEDVAVATLPSALALGWLAEEAALDSKGAEAALEAYRAEPDRLVQRLAVLTIDFALQFDDSSEGNIFAPTIDDTDGDDDDADADADADTDGDADNSGVEVLDPGNFFFDDAADDGNNRRTQEEPLVPTYAVFGVDECEWPTVVCNATNGVVTRLQMGLMGLPGRIPSEIGLLTSLTYLDLAQNELKGSIPETIFQMTSLQQLYLYQNQLTGTLSAEAGVNWSQLTRLHLSQNQLTGSIPPEWKSGVDEIQNFRYINLSNNKLSGVIPRNLRWRQLFFLDLGHNQLTGTLPVTLGENFIRLKHLHLDHNSFSGTLPESYINVGNGRLEQLTINNNQLTGEVPDNHELSNKLVLFNLQNNLFDEGLGKGTCELAVFVGGENVDFKADCDICDCKSFFCEDC